MRWSVTYYIPHIPAYIQQQPHFKKKIRLLLFKMSGEYVLKTPSALGPYLEDVKRRKRDPRAYSGNRVPWLWLVTCQLDFSRQLFKKNSEI